MPYIFLRMQREGGKAPFIHYYASFAGHISSYRLLKLVLPMKNNALIIS